MSVLYDPLDHENLVLPTHCTECGDQVVAPAVFWQGATALLFHPDCAAMLGPHLIADAREATLAADPGPHWGRRLFAAVRARLVTAEFAA